MPMIYNDNNDTTIIKALTSSGDNISYILDNSNNIIVDFRKSPQGLITDSWDVISARSNAGTAANYYSVGDCKEIVLNGTVGTLNLENLSLYVYIIGFDHNLTKEIPSENGVNLYNHSITFGGFKTYYDSFKSDAALVDTHYNTFDTSGLKWFNMNHYQGNSRYGHNFGGWKGCDLRYDVLGSTDNAPSGYGTIATVSNVGYDASSTCATNPVENTLMSCLPSDLRAVMKPIIKYTDNVGGNSNVNGNITSSIDYLPLLAEYEIFGKINNANEYEQNSQAQYAYYVNTNNIIIKRKYNEIISKVVWLERSPLYASETIFCAVGSDGNSSRRYARASSGIAPIFAV